MFLFCSKYHSGLGWERIEYDEASHCSKSSSRLLNPDGSKVKKPNLRKALCAEICSSFNNVVQSILDKKEVITAL